MVGQVSTKSRPHAGAGFPWRKPSRVSGAVRSYVYGSYVDELLAILPASGVVGERKFVHANHLYSVAALTDNSGNVVERYRYDAYGQRTVLAADGVTVRAASSYANQYGFTGRYLDKETGLWYFRARYYSGSLGRFVSRDPLRYINGTNLYRAYFVPNYFDPLGMYTSDFTFMAKESSAWDGVDSWTISWKLTVKVEGEDFIAADILTQVTKDVTTDPATPPKDKECPAGSTYTDGSLAVSNIETKIKPGRGTEGFLVGGDFGSLEAATIGMKVGTKLRRWGRATISWTCCTKGGQHEGASSTGSSSEEKKSCCTSVSYVKAGWEQSHSDKKQSITLTGKEKQGPVKQGTLTRQQEEPWDVE